MTLRERILRVLAESPLAVSTRDMVALVAPVRLRGRRRQVWSVLRALERRGLAAREYRVVRSDYRDRPARQAFWRGTKQEADRA